MDQRQSTHKTALTAALSYTHANNYGTPTYLHIHVPSSPKRRQPGGDHPRRANGTSNLACSCKILAGLYWYFQVYGGGTLGSAASLFDAAAPSKVQGHRLQSIKIQISEQEHGRQCTEPGTPAIPSVVLRVCSRLSCRIVRGSAYG